MLEAGRTPGSIAALSSGVLTTDANGVSGEGVTTGVGGSEAIECGSAGDATVGPVTVTLWLVSVADSAVFAGGSTSVPTARTIGLLTGAKPRLRLAKPGPVFHRCLRPPRPRPPKPRPLPLPLPLPLGALFGWPGLWPGTALQMCPSGPGVSAPWLCERQRLQICADCPSAVQRP